MRSSVRFAAIAAIIVLPFMANAQESGLQAAIRAEIEKDPRSASIPRAQMDAMVASLAQAAQQQGVSEVDITWRPAAEGPESVAPRVCTFFCQIDEIFGFSGDDYTIPLGLGITSALLILFISLMLHRHHKHGIVPPTVESIHTHS